MYIYIQCIDIYIQYVYIYIQYVYIQYIYIDAIDIGENCWMLGNDADAMSIPLGINPRSKWQGRSLRFCCVAGKNTTWMLSPWGRGTVGPSRYPSMARCSDMLQASPSHRRWVTVESLGRRKKNTPQLQIAKAKVSPRNVKMLVPLEVDIYIYDICIYLM